MTVIVRERMSWMGLQVGRKDHREHKRQSNLLITEKDYVSTRIEESRMEVRKGIPSSWQGDTGSLTVD